uniref:uncharacterized protein At3g17950-like n=1 Tax=Erigeron canadensis TaxID=72917 RepID=UPI001CB89064|nr:uncharacterized protein At3g17950-like [Erigeron canadensis]
MAHQVEEGGWPLGLQPLNMRSVSFSTFISGSPSSLSHSSSDLDTESTGSFFHDRSITLGNLLGVSSIVELSRRRHKTVSESVSLGTNTKSNTKFKPWCFGLCLCQRDNDDDIVNTSNNNIIPLGHFLEVERRAAQDINRQGQHSPLIYGPDELALAQPFGESLNSLFSDGQIVPPTMSSQWPNSDTSYGRRDGRGFITPCF